MLFDLRGRGRRRAVQAIYLSLAILMGGGLVLFGIGGATNGGLLDAFTSNGNTVDVSEAFKKRVDKAEAAVKARPNDAKAWAELTRVRVQQASSGNNFNANTGQYTNEGLQELRRAEQAYSRYTALAKKPDGNIAGLMVGVYAQGALNQPAKAVTAMEVVVDNRKPTGPLYAQLAALAYQARQTRKAELASDKALELTPKDQRQEMRDQLNQYRLQASGQLSGGDASTDGGTSTSILPGG